MACILAAHKEALVISINAQFAEYDLNGDGQVTAAEYVDPIPR